MPKYLFLQARNSFKKSILEKLSKYRETNVGDYRYELPAHKIASYPLDKRDRSKLLVYRHGEISDDSFKNIIDYFDSSNTLVFNNTRVIRSRLLFRKETGALIEIFCLEPYNPSSYEQALESTHASVWKCMVGNLKKWKEGPLELKLPTGEKSVHLNAEKAGKSGRDTLVRFTWDKNDLSFGEILEFAGHVPVPPYLNRDDEPVDKIRYQTVYSERDGSVAAPTAGLHFTSDLLAKLEAKGVKSADITLHVGAGTFVPVKTDTIGDHKMHREYFSVHRKSIESLLKHEIIAIGTTSVRTIESLYTLGAKLASGYRPQSDLPEIRQWEAYSLNSISVKDALAEVLAYMDKRGVGILEASTSIIIVPGYSFKIVKGLVTNFHMPASTLLLLVSALIGKDWRRVYEHALNNDYRFLSYGDSSLLLPRSLSL